MSVKINKLELENVKRVRAVQLTPTANGLTVIGGRNGQGKTSVLDAIAWALGGDRFRPEAAKRDGSVLDPVLRVQLSNGLTVTRKGAKSSLTVTDTTGRRSGQQLLNEFVEVLALDLPRFLGATDKERANTLLGILGIQDQLDALEREERAKYDTRLQVGRDRDRAKHYAEELPWYHDAPETEVSVTELAAELKQAQAVVNSNMSKRVK
jgi:DNA repair exonuclease SbcCD ATPase subunit